MKKILSISFIIIIAAVIVIYLNISNITKSVIEDAATQTLGVDVKITQLDIDVIGKTASANGIKIYNPENFSEPLAIDIGTVNVKLGQISPELINIEEINISNTKIFLEVTKNGTNLGKIADNTKSVSEPSKQKETSNKTDEASSNKIIIDNFSITNSEIIPQITLIKGSKSGKIALPDIKLQGIGKKENGILVKDAIAQITQKVIKNAEQSSYDAGMLKGMAKNVLENMKLDTSMIDKAKDTIDNITDDAKKIGDELKDGLKDGLKNIFKQ